MPNKYFVHRYDVIRIKVAVEAESQQEAMELADIFIDELHPVGDRHVYRDLETEQREVEYVPLPCFLHHEHAEEVAGYLVDEVGDTHHENTREYDRSMNPVLNGYASHEIWTRSHWRSEVMNGDTILGYQDWVSHNIEAEKENA